jgi:hypothetical protein
MQLPQVGPELEPEMERLLARLVHDFESQVKGASLEEIAAIERIAGRPLPRYYRWFLWRMGRSMGPFAYKRLDFSARRILDCYENGIFKADPRFLIIGFATDPVYPGHMAYDLDHPARDDARVNVYMNGRPLLDDLSYETLREMHTHAALDVAKISTRPQRVSAVLSSPQEASVAEGLASVMAKLGFTSPIKTGPYCLLYEREDAALVGSTTLSDEVPKHQAVHLGARDQAEIRRILGILTVDAGIEVDVDEWDPELG